MEEQKNQPDHEQTHDDEQNSPNGREPQNNELEKHEPVNTMRTVVSPVAAAFIGLIGGFFFIPGSWRFINSSCIWF